MDDTKRVFAVFLALLFIIIVIGVTINRIAKDKAKIPLIGGSLERVLFPHRPTAAPTQKELAEKADNTVVIKKTASSQPGLSQTPLAEAIEDGSQGTLGQTTYGTGETKGGQADTIPETGAPAAIIIFSLSGLASGFMLKRKASSKINTLN